MKGIAWCSWRRPAQRQQIGYIKFIFVRVKMPTAMRRHVAPRQTIPMTHSQLKRFHFWCWGPARWLFVATVVGRGSWKLKNNWKNIIEGGEKEQLVKCADALFVKDLWKLAWSINKKVGIEEKKKKQKLVMKNILQIHLEISYNTYTYIMNMQKHNLNRSRILQIK